jgi:hypothetical protein
VGKNKVRLWGAGALAVMAIFIYQNCGKGFVTVTDESADLASMDHSLPHVTLNSSVEAPNVDLEFSVHTESLPHSVTYQWSYLFNGNASGCTEKSQLSSTVYILNCANTGSLTVGVKVMDGKQLVPIQKYFTQLTNQVAEPTLQAKFTIPMGTGNKPWNSPSSPMEVYVGQTLTITNADSVNHQLHTNGRPCAHGNPMSSGGTSTCVISQSYSSASNGPVYEHNVDASAAFYLIAYDGSELYNTSCMGCHGALASSTKKRKTAAQIQQAIFNRPEMKVRPALIGMSAKQIEAIAFALSK